MKMNPKKIIHYSLFLILFTVLFTSCHKDMEMETQNFTYDSTFHLTNDTSLGKFSLSVETELPVKYFNNEVLHNIQKQIIAKMFGEIYNSLPIDSILPNYAHVLFNEYKRANEPYLQSINDMKGAGKFLESDIQIQGVAMYLDQKVLSYSYERFANMGDNYNKSSRLLYNFDLSNSHLIKESDIFVANYRQSLKQLIQQQIVEENAEIGSIADLHDFNYYKDMITPNDNFYISGEGLVYVYNPYDIAQYTTEQFEVLLPYDKLKPLMKPNNIISHIYNENNKEDKSS